MGSKRRNIPNKLNGCHDGSVLFSHRGGRETLKYVQHAAAAAAAEAKLAPPLSFVPFQERSSVLGVDVGAGAKGEAKQNEIMAELANYRRFHQR